MTKTKKSAKGQMIKSKQRRKSSVMQDEEGIKQEINNNYFVKVLSIEFDEFEESFEDVNIESCINPVTKGLNIKKLVILLQRDFNIFSKDKLIKFYLPEGGVYITVPPTKKALSSMEIDQSDYLSTQTIKLQLFKNRQLVDVVMEDSQEESNENGDEQQEMENDQKALEGKCRRLKQRKIKHVIQKVLKWRELYAGMQNGQENSLERVSLQEGAKIVKISKKTLDDYLSQLKKGKKYGFNFNDHKNQKIGVLRQFIRKMEKKR